MTENSLWSYFFGEYTQAFGTNLFFGIFIAICALAVYLKTDSLEATIATLSIGYIACGTVLGALGLLLLGIVATVLGFLWYALWKRFPSS